MRKLPTLILVFVAFSSFSQERIYAGLYIGEEHDNAILVQLIPLNEYHYYYYEKTDIFYLSEDGKFIMLDRIGRSWLKDHLKTLDIKEQSKYKKFTKAKTSRYFYDKFTDTVEVTRRNTKEMKKAVQRNEHLRDIYF